MVTVRVRVRVRVASPQPSSSSRYAGTREVGLTPSLAPSLPARASRQSEGSLGSTEGQVAQRGSCGALRRWSAAASAAEAAALVRVRVRVRV